jgi:cytokinin dehydrogenase
MLRSNAIMSFISLFFTLFISNLSLPEELFSLEIGSKILTDKQSVMSVASDFGNMTKSIPAAVFYPSSTCDIAALIHFSYTHSAPFFVSPRGHGHSISGQTSCPDGVVIQMESLGQGCMNRINISVANQYVDVGGEQLWIDLLNVAHRHGLGANSWTDYLYLTVGGTLSVGGISGQTFQNGPQISNVLELDVITGNMLQISLKCAYFYFCLVKICVACISSNHKN